MTKGRYSKRRPISVSLSIVWFTYYIGRVFLKTFGFQAPSLYFIFYIKLYHGVFWLIFTGFYESYHRLLNQFEIMAMLISNNSFIFVVCGYLFPFQEGNNSLVSGCYYILYWVFDFIYTFQRFVVLLQAPNCLGGIIETCVGCIQIARKPAKAIQRTIQDPDYGYIISRFFFR